MSFAERCGWLVVAVACSARTEELAVASARIGSSGGILTAGTLRLELPEGALDGSTRVGVFTIADAELPEGAVAETGWRIEPSDTRLGESATLELGFDPEDAPSGEAGWIFAVRLGRPLRALRRPVAITSGGPEALVARADLAALGSFAVVDLAVAGDRADAQLEIGEGGGVCFPFEPTDVDPEADGPQLICRIDLAGAEIFECEPAGTEPCWQGVECSEVGGMGADLVGVGGVGDQVSVSCMTLDPPL